MFIVVLPDEAASGPCLWQENVIDGQLRSQATYRRHR
uniref:Uncharacterized protein n=1 Tax=Siphoviridae sp. ctGa111 TaxID=2825413 RepID=A0A8S5VDH5_9CAUD|nr:MAG TPA: hypothetical protein [Siphoviridae sp. ctGa111]